MTPSDDEHSTHTAEIAEVLRTRYWSWTFYDRETTPANLLELFTERLPHISSESWAERFDFGGVYINGREVLVDQPLPLPCRVEYYEPKFEISAAKSVFPEFRDDYVIYRDEHIIVVYKPPGLSTMPAKEQRHYSLKASIEKLTGHSIHMPSRLDVSAQGIVIASISPSAHAALQQAFELRRVNKTYLCASHQEPKWQELRVTTGIGRDPSHPVLRTTQAVTTQEAETIFKYCGETLSNGSRAHFLIARPITGRTHQIRVHAASEGVPLLGDRFYGGAPAAHLHLLSYSLTCAHPVSGRTSLFSLTSSLIPDWARAVSTHSEL